MLDIGHMLSLLNHKIRSIGFLGHCNTVFIDRFINVVNIVQIQKIGNFHFLNGPHDFILNRNLFPALPVNDLLPEIIQFTAHGSIICICHMVKKVIDIITFIGRVKVRGKEKNQAVYHTGIPKNLLPEIILYAIIQLASVNNISLFRIILMQNGIACGMKCGNGAGNVQLLLNLVPKLFHCFIGKGNNQNLIRRNSLFFHQVFHFGCYGSGLSGAGSCNHQTVILISQNHLSLVFIQADLGVYIL